MSAPRTPPRARPAAVLVGLLVALLLVAVAVVAVRDLAVTQGWATGTSWTLDAVESLDGLGASTGLTVAGVVAAAIGLLLVWLALVPGRRTHLRTTGDSDLWVSAGALAALARHTADRVGGVIGADAARVSRRRVVIDVVTAQERGEVSGRVESALDDLRTLTPARLSVRTKEVPR